MKRTLLSLAFLSIMSCLSAQTFSYVCPNGNGYAIYYEVLDSANVAVTRASEYSTYCVLDTGVLRNDGVLWSYTLPIVIPDSVTYMGNTYCVSMVMPHTFSSLCIETHDSVLSAYPVIEVSLPGTINLIGSYAFSGYNGLSLVFRGETVPDFGNTIFSRGQQFNVTVPCSAYASWYSKLQQMNDYNYGLNWNWTLFSENILITNDVYSFDMGVVNIDTFEVSNQGQYWINTEWEQIDLITLPCGLSTATLRATAREGYHFTHWSDGGTQCTTTVSLPCIQPIIAYFAPGEAEYSIVVESADSAIGHVTGSGIYQNGDTAILVASPSEHHHFLYWSDGNSDNPRQYAVMHNDTLIAYFAIDTHTVNVTSCDITRGRVIGGGEFEYGSPCSISAEAYSGYVFSQWSNGATYNPYTFAVMEDTELTAIFVAEGDVGVDDIETDGIHIYSIDGHILVNGTIDEVRIFDIVGRNIRNEALPAGVYMVKIGNHPARKVVVIR